MEYVENVYHCKSGKPCFATRAEIESYIYYRNMRKGGKGFKFYKCPECGCYHLTTNTPTGEQELKRKARAYNRSEKKHGDERLLKMYRLAM
jgi:predicted transcriptional regulator